MLFESIFNTERKNGCVYSYLYPFSFHYYNQFGYGPGGCRVTVTIPIERLKGYECSYDVTLYKPGDPIEPYQAISEQFNSNYTGTVKLKDWSKLDDYTPEKNRKSLFLFSDKGTPKAFFGFKNEGNLIAHDILHKPPYYAWTDIDAFKNILGFIYKLRMHNKNLVITLPESFPIEAMLSEQGGVKMERYVSGQVRIINVKEALSVYPWPERDGELHIGVHDDFFADNCGVYKVSFGNGSVSVSKSSGLPDIELDIKALSPLLFGVYGYGDLGYLPADWITFHKNGDLLHQAFIRRPVFINDQF